MIRFHFTFDKDEMSRWLNEMDRKGWALTQMAAGFCRFDPVQPGTYEYQVDYAGFGRIDPAYAGLMDELGVDMVCRWGPWLVLRRPAAEGPFVLYTDADSRLAYLRRIKAFFRITASLEILCAGFVLAYGAEESSWVLMAVGIVGLIAAGAMIVRIRQLQAEMIELGEPADRLMVNRRCRILIAAGCASILVGLLLPDAGAAALVTLFLKGFGCGAILVGLLQLI